MIESIDIIWYEEAPDGSGSISLDEFGKVNLHMEEGRWCAEQGALRVTMPEWAFDALIRHKGETRRFLQEMRERETSNEAAWDLAEETLKRR